MTSILPTQEQVDQIARSLAPDVVRIRMRDALDWSDDPALYFYVILADEVAPRLYDVASATEKRLQDELRLFDVDRYFYVRFRSESEQQRLQEELWD